MRKVLSAILIIVVKKVLEDQAAGYRSFALKLGFMKTGTSFAAQNVVTFVCCAANIEIAARKNYS
ncbi:hypothetical protein [Rhizobium sp. R339]|uniref:hypothetical protein n=1 Tax=Rhizobium sp. R339 TaxID=1764273 RepID=UPI00113177F5|nr:hypothetical protein [Rhizobium sp. R339]